MFEEFFQEKSVLIGSHFNLYIASYSSHLFFYLVLMPEISKV